RASGPYHFLLPRRRRGARHRRHYSRSAGGALGQKHPGDALWRRVGMSVRLAPWPRVVPHTPKFGYIVTARGNFLGTKKLLRIGGIAETRSWRCGIPLGQGRKKRTAILGSRTFFLHWMDACGAVTRCSNTRATPSAFSASTSAAHPSASVCMTGRAYNAAS